MKENLIKDILKSLVKNQYNLYISLLLKLILIKIMFKFINLKFICFFYFNYKEICLKVLSNIEKNKKFLNCYLY